MEWFGIRRGRSGMSGVGSTKGTRRLRGERGIGVESLAGRWRSIPEEVVGIHSCYVDAEMDGVGGVVESVVVVVVVVVK